MRKKVYKVSHFPKYTMIRRNGKQDKKDLGDLYLAFQKQQKNLKRINSNNAESGRTKRTNPPDLAVFSGTTKRRI